MKLKPIETAPKDGTKILLLGGMVHGEIYKPRKNIGIVASWEDMDYAGGKTWMDYPEGKTWIGFNGLFYEIVIKRPTHWCELPKAEDE